LVKNYTGYPQAEAMRGNNFEAAAVFREDQRVVVALLLLLSMVPM